MELPLLNLNTTLHFIKKIGGLRRLLFQTKLLVTSTLFICTGNGALAQNAVLDAINQAVIHQLNNSLSWFALMTEFMPHGHCYLWKPGLVWLHVASDIVIGLSYFSIPVALWIYTNRRKEATFRGMFILFGVFIGLCGLTHFLAVYNVWQGDYWLSGYTKMATALVSLATAIVLMKSLPAALEIPLPQEFLRVRKQLEEASKEREDVEKRLEARMTEQTRHLWNSDSRWKLLSEFVYSAVWVCDASGNVTQHLPSWERFTGQTFDEYKGDGWLIAYLDCDRGPLFEKWKDCVREGKTLEFETHLWSVKSQKHVPVLSKGFPIKDREGNILEWMGVIHDLSDIKRQEVILATYSRRLQAKNQYLQEFAHAASHDLREPLRKIQAYGDILHEDCSHNLPESGQQCIHVMQNAAARLSTLIDELLDYSRASSAELNIQKVDLSELLDQVEEDLEVAILESNAKIQREYIAPLSADPIMLQRILQNLIGNAVKYRDPNRSPIVKLSSRIVSRSSIDSPEEANPFHQYCEIVVADNGIGFDTRHVEKILRPFQRLHNREEYPGTGMGLAICHRLAERHNGFLLAESEQGVGSTFKIYIPEST